MRRLALPFCLAWTIAACAPSNALPSAGGRDAITRDAIRSAAASYSNAYEVVERLRPQWLRKRSTRIATSEYTDTMEGDIAVYMNNARLGGLDALRDIDVETVAEIRFLDAAQATRLGTGHQHGAIMVRTR